MITGTNFKIKNLPNKKLKTFYVRNSNGQFEYKSLNLPVKNDFTVKLGRISGRVLIH